MKRMKRMTSKFTSTNHTYEFLISVTSAVTPVISAAPVCSVTLATTVTSSIVEMGLQRMT